MAFEGDKDSLRKGKWVQEEEAYATRLIQLFNQGLLVLPEGTTLRSFLAEKLNCDPMRITKKFTGASCLGKRVFHSRKHTDATLAETQNAQHELNCLEARFHSRLEHDRERSKEACMIDLEARFLNASNVVSSPAIDAFIMQSCANQTWTSKAEPDDGLAEGAHSAVPAAATTADALEGPPPPAASYAHAPEEATVAAVPRANHSYWVPAYAHGPPHGPTPAEATCVDASTSSWSGVHAAAVHPASSSVHVVPDSQHGGTALPMAHAQAVSENNGVGTLFTRSSAVATCDQNSADLLDKAGETNGCHAAGFQDDEERRDPGLCLPLDGGHNKRMRCEQAILAHSADV